MSSDLVTLVLVGGLAVGAWYIFTQTDLFRRPGGVVAIPTVVAGATTASPIASGNVGPANCASSDHEADKGFGFSKDGGPVESDGYTADEGEPRVGDNRKRNSLTIAQLPGPCETKPYKGKVQYRFQNLSASCETCTQAKQYYLYKYGLGGVWPVPGTNGGEGVREGGAKGPGVTHVLPNKGGTAAGAGKAKAKAHLAYQYEYDGKFHYPQRAAISTLRGLY